MPVAGTCDVAVIRAGAGAGFWLFEYLPEVPVDDRYRFPTVLAIVQALNGGRVELVPMPADCSDYFLGAWYGQPDLYLDSDVRAAQSASPRLPLGVKERAVDSLAVDLASGTWDARHGYLSGQESYDTGLRFIIADPLGIEHSTR